MNVTQVTDEQKKYCRRCGRELKNPQFKELGFGPTCYKKHIRELLINRKRLFPIDKNVQEVTAYEVNI